jgi:hypothetical protein
MTALRRSVISSAEQLVQIVYLDRSTSKWWNQRRRPDDTATFCGWYWIRGRDEMGPFRSRSSCVRDAYYRFVLKRELPSVGHSLLQGVTKIKPATYTSKGARLLQSVTRKRGSA